MGKRLPFGRSRSLRGLVLVPSWIALTAGCQQPEPTSQVENRSRPKFVGGLCYVRDFKAHTITFYKNPTGGVIRVTDDGWGKSKGTLPYTGIPIWDSSRRRLFLIGKGDKPNDTKEIVEMVGDGWQKGNRVWLSDYAMGFDGIVGDPDIGPFAVFEASNRARYLTGLFRWDLSRIKTDALDVADIGPLGILSIRGTRDGLQNIQPTELVCLDPRSGKVVWRNSKNLQGKWDGDRVRSGLVLLDGKTGRGLRRRD